jgi:hypothetical protein
MNQDEQDTPQYEAPVVEDVDTAESPASTVAGVSLAR